MYKYQMNAAVSEELGERICLLAFERRTNNAEIIRRLLKFAVEQYDKNPATVALPEPHKNRIKK